MIALGLSTLLSRTSEKLLPLSMNRQMHEVCDRLPVQVAHAALGAALSRRPLSLNCTLSVFSARPRGGPASLAGA
jgi:hypothetical protein